MPSKTDHPDGPSTLPVPELNPLLNPVLGQHMGRWAEVYFTSPPERREQAVLELLHELQGETAPEAAGLTAPTSAPEKTLEPVFEPASGILEVSAKQVRCNSCGRENPAAHRFCGMCGAPVGGRAAVPSDPLFEDSLAGESTSHSQGDETAFVRHEEAVYEPALSTNELSLFQGRREESYRDDHEDKMFSYSTPSRSYRVYVGIALAIVIFALGYMAWRSAQGTSQSLHVEPQAPPAVTQPEAPAPVPPSTSTSTPPSKTATPDATASASQQAVAPPQPARGRENAKSSLDESARSAPPAIPVTGTDPAQRALSGNGSEELAIAQRYLTGANGEHRNSAEGARWLWKSMAKHNANATLLLADLYLKGDGVSKNCDQARVLLDSAARGGMKQAGERLRHLQAFGCE